MRRPAPEFSVPLPSLSRPFEESPHTMKLDNATVLITGANRGIGLAFAREALKRGARKVSAAARECGDVSILVNNAGIASVGGFLAEDTVESAQRHFDTNVYGLIRMSR